VIEELDRLRVRLTAWYVGVFALVLLVFGGGLFYVVTREISADLDESLQDATEELARATEIRQREGPPGPGRVDALDELRIPDRSLYLLDAGGRPIHPDTVPPWLQSIAVQAARGGPLIVEHDLTTTTTWRAYATPFQLPDGEHYVAVAAADVVELQHRYPALLLAFGAAAVVALLLVGLGGWLLARRSTEPVRDAFQRMRGFMADAAHELRTPVGVVKVHAEVALRQPRKPDEYVEILRAVHGEAARLGGILENVLTIARADAGVWPARHESLFLDDLLLDVADNARVLGEAKGIAIQVTALDEAAVRGDPELLRQLLMILLDNAVKFTQPGGHVDVAAQGKGDHVEVSVSDDGPGIEPELIPHIFDRFYRGDSARSRAAGAGLGLSIARWIADEHHATIHVDSAPGRGTRVTVTFPLEQST
jgi:signal transduction histidine kinase